MFLNVRKTENYGKKNGNGHHAGGELTCPRCKSPLLLDKEQIMGKDEVKCRACDFQCFIVEVRAIDAYNLEVQTSFRQPSSQNHSIYQTTQRSQ